MVKRPGCFEECGFMQREVEIVESKVKMLDEELGVMGDEVSALMRDHREDVDTLRLEIETLKLILAQTVPDFSERYARMKEKARLEVIPE
jgi:hypothetical protein